MEVPLGRGHRSIALGAFDLVWSAVSTRCGHFGLVGRRKHNDNSPARPGGRGPTAKTFLENEKDKGVLVSEE